MKKNRWWTYLSKKKILFKGTANEIFFNIFNNINLMIKSIVFKIPKPKEQKGKITIYENISERNQF